MPLLMPEPAVVDRGLEAAKLGARTAPSINSAR